MIEACRRGVSSQVNSALVVLYWSVGSRLASETLGGNRAAYGKRLIDGLGDSLAADYGRGFSAKNLRRMIQFARQFPDCSTVVTLSRQLSWSHFFAIIAVRDASAREYYARVASGERWSVRELRRRIRDKTWERTALASLQQGQTPEAALGATADTGSPGPDLVFKDPYFLEFLGLPPGFDEKELETAILRDIERFILELGKGFAFVERQKRITLDGDDFYIDLLFFHRRLRRLVVVELKLGRFKAAHKGQMELYLRWLDRYERQADEEAPIGLILCAEASREQVELLEMHREGIMVAEYWTELPPKHEIEAHLHRALAEARERLATRRLLDSPNPQPEDDEE